MSCEVVSVDWRMPLDQVRHFLPHTLQGNLDPAVLLAPPAIIAQEAQKVLRAGLGGAHIFNLGHGVIRTTPPEHVACLVEAVREFNRHTEVST